MGANRPPEAILVSWEAIISKRRKEGEENFKILGFLKL